MNTAKAATFKSLGLVLLTALLIEAKSFAIGTYPFLSSRIAGNGFVLVCCALIYLSFKSMRDVPHREVFFSKENTAVKNIINALNIAIGLMSSLAFLVVCTHTVQNRSIPVGYPMLAIIIFASPAMQAVLLILRRSRQAEHI